MPEIWIVRRGDMGNEPAAKIVLQRSELWEPVKDRMKVTIPTSSYTYIQQTGGIALLYRNAPSIRTTYLIRPTRSRRRLPRERAGTRLPGRAGQVHRVEI